MHARAHEIVEQTLSALARQGISKEAYLRSPARTRRRWRTTPSPTPRSALRREAVLAAIVEAEQIDPSDEDVVEALEPAAERDGSDPGELVEQLRKAGRLESLREDVAGRQAVELLVRGGEADQRRAGQGAREALDARAMRRARQGPVSCGPREAEPRRSPSGHAG